MISKSLFINLQKEDLKKRIWLIVLSLVGAFLIRPIYLLMRLQSIKYYSLNYRVEALEAIYRFFSVQNVLNGIGVIMIAILLGISGYSYLFSKNKTDFYHSIPLKREKMFLSFYLNGIVIYVTIYILMQFVCMIILLTQGFLEPLMFVKMFTQFIQDGIFFLYVYHTIILAVMLTGHLAVAIAGSIVLLSYGPVVIQTLNGYYETYFNSYYQTSYLTFSGSKWSILSPISAYMYYLGISDLQITVDRTEANLYLAGCLLIAILLFVLCIWLYKQRNSEVAEKAMAFSKTEAIIKILIVVPAAIMGAGILSGITDTRDGGWYWFGLLFTGILVHATIETIYRFDFKAILNRKLQLVLCLALAAVVALGFQKDLFGYEKYLPDENQVESAGIAFININSDCYDYGVTIENGILVTRNYMQSDEYSRLASMKITDIPTIERMAQLGIQYTLENRGKKQVYNNCYSDEDEEIRFVIRYNLKNGKEKYRYYTVPVNDILPYARTIFKSSEYKEHENLLAEIVNHNLTDSIQKLSVYDNTNNKILTINHAYVQEIMATYEEENRQLTMDDIQNQNIILRIEPEVMIPDNYTETLYGYYVYPSFKKTIALLKNVGLQDEALIEKLNENSITSIEVSGSLSNTESVYEDDYKDNYKEITYNKETDAEKIKELNKVMIPGTFAWNNYVLKPFEEYLTIEAYYENEKGIRKSNTMVVPKGKLPEFIYNDFKVE